MGKNPNKPKYDTTARVMAMFKSQGKTRVVRRKAESEGRCYEHPGNFLPCSREHTE